MHRCIRLLQERQKDIAQNVLHAHTPRVGPHLFEDLKEAGCCKCDPVLSNMSQWIVAKGLMRIGCIQIRHVPLTPIRYLTNYSFNQVSVWIDKREPDIASNIL